MRLVNIGYGNVVVAERVVAVISPDSAPMKRFKDEARKAGRLIDGTQGRRTRSILITDSHHIVLSALQTETVGERLERGGHAQSPQAAVQHADARHAPEESAESAEAADQDSGDDAEPLEPDAEDDGAGPEPEPDKDPEARDDRDDKDEGPSE